MVFIDEVESFYEYNKSFLQNYISIDRDIVNKLILLGSAPSITEKLRKDLIDGLEKVQILDKLIFDVEAQMILITPTKENSVLLEQTKSIIAGSKEKMTLSETNKFIDVLKDYQKKINKTLRLQETVNPIALLIGIGLVIVVLVLIYKLILYVSSI